MFKKIVAWQKGDDLVAKIYELTHKFFPKEEIYGLTAQIRRAAVSIAANIAEGSATKSLKEYLRFLYLAKASLTETEYYIYLAHRLGYFQDEVYEKLDELRKEVGRVLHGLIKSIEKKVKQVTQKP